MRIAIVKLSALGDIVHAMIVLQFIKKFNMEISIDWIVEKRYKGLLDCNQDIDNIHSVDLRMALKKKSIFMFVKELRKLRKLGSYDLVIDMQNNLKSAFISYLCKHDVVGMDSTSVREYPAHLAYSKKINVDKKLHAIERQKKLLGEALGYDYKRKSIDYGASFKNFIEPNIKLPNNYIVLVQNASWVTKQWSIGNWQHLIQYLENKSINMLLPSGNLEELERAKKICSVSEKAQAIDLMSLDKIAYIVKNADFCICSDTGLAHLSALTGTPSITLYGPTQTALIVTVGINQNHLVGNKKNINQILVSDVIKELDKYYF